MVVVATRVAWSAAVVVGAVVVGTAVILVGIALVFSGALVAVKKKTITDCHELFVHILPHLDYPPIFT